MVDILTGVKAYQKAANDLYLKSLLYPENNVTKIPGHYLYLLQQLL